MKITPGLPFDDDARELGFYGVGDGAERASAKSASRVSSPALEQFGSCEAQLNDFQTTGTGA